MKYILVVFALFLTSYIHSQSNDLNRIILTAIVFDRDNTLPQEAKNYLQTKLEQIASEYGISGYNLNPRFVLSAKINTTIKDFIAGPPQKMVLNTEINFFIGDAIDNQVYSSTTMSIKGVGTNENKALISAIQQISTKNKNFTDLVSLGKGKILSYYIEKCDFIIQKSKMLAEQQKYEEAICELMQVPQLCKACYEKSMISVQPIFQSKINKESILALNQAKVIWNSNPNINGAHEVAKLLASIDPSSVSYKDALIFSEVVRKKIEVDEKKKWDFKMQKYADSLKLEKQRLEAIKQIVVSYYQNLPQNVTYNNLFK